MVRVNPVVPELPNWCTRAASRLCAKLSASKAIFGYHHGWFTIGTNRQVVSQHKMMFFKEVSTVLS